MARLRDAEDDFFALVGATAAATGVPIAFVEKDYWVTELLRSVAKPLTPDSPNDVRVVFKGGTSLSKAYGLIQRFSEDVDVLLVTSGLGKGATHRVLKTIAERACVDLDLDDERCELRESTRGIKRNVRYRCALRNESHLLSTGVLLEMGVRGGSEPSEVHRLRSTVALHAIEALGDPEDLWDEFAPVEIAVLGAERTLVEKLALLHHAASQAEENPQLLSAAGRHYYDIFTLLSTPDVVGRLVDLPGAVERLAIDVGRRSDEAGFPSTPRPNGGYATSPAFAASGIATELATEAYAAIEGLVWGAFPPFEQGLKTVHARASLL